MLVSAYNEVNQLYLCIYPLPLGPPSHPARLGHHRAPSWAPGAILQFPSSYLYYVSILAYLCPTWSANSSYPPLPPNPVSAHLHHCSCPWTVVWFYLPHDRGFPIAQMVENLPVTLETGVWFLGQEDPLEKGMATHSSTLAWIQWTKEPGGLQSTGLQRVQHDRVTNTLLLLDRVSETSTL